MKAILSDDRTMVNTEVNGCFISYPVDEFIAMYGEDSPPESQLANQPDIDSFLEYWEAAINLVNAWAAYQAKRKLFANASCGATRHRVQLVIDGHYGGNLDNLEKAIMRLYADVEKCLGIFAYYCRLHKLEPIGITWLRRHLLEGKNYKAIRDKCRRKMSSGKEPVSLNELVR